MTKNEIAMNINAKIKGLARTISIPDNCNITDYYTVGAEYDNLEKAESWTNGGTFNRESDSGKEVFIRIENEVDCHKVDYEDEVECFELGAQDCEEEQECLIPASQKLIVVSFSSESDFEEMGYYEMNVRAI